MLIITKENNSIKVVGQNNPTYPYSGTLVYPLNSVTVVTDQSNMAVFRSALNNDVLFTGLIDDITIAGSPVTKEDIGTKFGAISNSASTGGGAVDSVNGHTGAVVLTASDVNAYSKEESDGKYATKAEIPSTDNLATKEELALKADKSSLGNYLLKSEAQSTYATKSELGSKLDVETYNSDKAAFALKSELPDTSSFITKATADETYQPKGEYLTSVPDNYVTDEELNGKGYATTAQLNGKQDTLVSGTNIKTINGNSLLGSGDITIEGGGITDAPSDNKLYARKNAQWSEMSEATTSANGLMSSADKTKLDSIDVASILSRITALETQMGEVSAKLDSINGETA